MSPDDQDHVPRRHVIQSLGIAGAAGASGLLPTACGGDGSDSSGNGGGASSSSGSGTTVTLHPQGNQMKYKETEFTVAPGTEMSSSLRILRRARRCSQCRDFGSAALGSTLSGGGPGGELGGGRERLRPGPRRGLRPHADVEAGGDCLGDVCDPEGDGRLRIRVYLSRSLVADAGDDAREGVVRPPADPPPRTTPTPTIHSVTFHCYAS